MVEATAASASEAERLLTHLAHALAEAGCPSHRLERALETAARRLQVPLVVLAQPTSLSMAFGPEPAQRVVLMRLEPSGQDLGRLSAVDLILADVVEGRLATPDALAALARARGRPYRWSLASRALAHVGLAGASAVLVDGTAGEVVISALIGGLLASFDRVLRAQPGMERLRRPVGAFLAATVAMLAVREGWSLDPMRVVVCGAIVLLPGLALTVGWIEVAAGHLASGTHRVAGALLALFELVIGVAAAEAVVAGGFDAKGGAQPLPMLAAPVAVVAASFALSVLLNARRRDVPWLMVSCAVAWLGARFAAPLGPALGAGVASFGVGLYANLWGHWARRTVIVPMVPGVLLLVPGAVGFRSVAALLSGDVLPGVSLLFGMGLAAGSLAAGLLLASALAGPTWRV
jgi:uncharacterized membrane protein YjjP (DUF1212 family)